MNKNELYNLIMKSMEEIISENENESKISVEDLNQDTRLLGRQAILDSLSLVSLIVNIEQKLSEENISVTIADERAMTQEKSPFRTIGSLFDYINMLIKELE
jgi:acyl carrier protein